MNARQQKHRLAREVARCRKRKAMSAQAALPRTETDRMRQKAAYREATLAQIENDKLDGLENGAVCRARYRTLRPKPKPAIRRQKSDIRHASTYRGARRNELRGPRKSLVLKAQRELQEAGL